jgi:hypothetical protein
LGELVVDSSSSEHGQEVGCFEYGDEFLSLVNCGEYIEQLRNYQLIKDVLFHGVD